MAVFLESNLFQELFEEIVDRCMEAGLVEGEHLSVDGSFIPANASRLSRIPRERLPEEAHVKRTVREYSADLERRQSVQLCQLLQKRKLKRFGIRYLAEACGSRTQTSKP